MSETSQLGYRAEAVYQRLRGDLVRGAYAPDARLPSIEQFARKYKVTPVTLRKAALRLASEGMLEVKHGSGMYVRKPEEKSQMSKTISVMSMFDGESLNTIQREVLARGFLLNPYSQLHHTWDVKAERMFLRRVLDDRHQGLLAFCSPIKPRNDDLLREIEYRGTRVIHIEHSRVEPPEQEYLLPDFRLAGRMAVDILLAAGYSPVRALYQKGNVSAPFIALILDGVRTACEERLSGYDVDAAHLEMPTHEDFERKIAKLVESIPDGAGIVSGSGAYGVYLMRELRRQGRSVPDKIGVIVIDVMGDPDPAIDVLSFNRGKIMSDAIAAVTSPESPKVRELVTPAHVTNETVRSK